MWTLGMLMSQQKETKLEKFHFKIKSADMRTEL